MTLQAFETLPSSAARFNSPSLFLMMRALRCSMVGLPFHLLGFDRASQPVSKRVTLPFATQQCQIRSELLHLSRQWMCAGSHALFAALTAASAQAAVVLGDASYQVILSSGNSTTSPNSPGSFSLLGQTAQLATAPAVIL